MRIEETIKAAYDKLNADADQIEFDAHVKAQALREKATSLANTVVPSSVTGIATEFHDDVLDFFRKILQVL